MQYTTQDKMIAACVSSSGIKGLAGKKKKNSSSVEKPIIKASARVKMTPESFGLKQLLSGLFIKSPILTGYSK